MDKNAMTQHLITAGSVDTALSLKGWALYTWDGNPSPSRRWSTSSRARPHRRVGGHRGGADPLVAGSRVLLTADSGDTGIGKTYGQYVTLGEPIARPAVVTGVTATARPGAIDVTWNAARRAARYFVSVEGSGRAPMLRARRSSSPARPRRSRA